MLDKLFRKNLLPEQHGVRRQPIMWKLFYRTLWDTLLAHSDGVRIQKRNGQLQDVAEHLNEYAQVAMTR